jgi:hypothetical protein
MGNMPQSELVRFLGDWLERQGYNAGNCRCAEFVAWYVENYPEGNKSILDAFWMANWRRETA